MKMYIAVLDQVPDHMVPVLVAHSVLGAHKHFIAVNKFEDMLDHGAYKFPEYIDWFENSFKKCVVQVNQTEFNKVCGINNAYIGYESTVLEGKPSCAIPLVTEDAVRPNVLKFAKLWKPKDAPP
jgi:hypothetical protein